MPEYYWAAEPPENGDRLVEHLNQKTDRFLSLFRRTHLARRIIRNYRYYHGLYYDSKTDNLDQELRQLGDQGQLVGLAVNHFRSLVQQLLILTTQGEIAWDTRAINGDPESLQQARIGNIVLDSLMESKGVSRIAKRAVEHALVLVVGYIKTVWDGDSGPPTSADPEQGIYTSYAGDVSYSNPTILDVVFDPRARRWPEDVKWVRIREQANIWDLVTKYQDLRDDILKWYGNKPEEEGQLRRTTHDYEEDEDWVDVWEFFHVPTEAMPDGRYVKSVGDVVLVDMPSPYPWIPIDRIVAGEQVGSIMGYTPAFDLQAIAEAYNAEMSNIASNHNAFGQLNVWLPSGTNIRERTLSGGLRVIFSDIQPVPLNLLDTSPELLNFANHLNLDGERLSGVNSVARGQPEANLKSGTALALIDAKAQQSASFLIESYHDAVGGVGTKSLKLIQLYGGDSQRFMAVAGRANRPYKDYFTSADLEKVDRVLVESGNPMMKSFTGRMELAEKVKPWIRTGEEYINFITTGQLETMLEADQNMLSHIREENAMLLDGGTVVASAIDNHVLHIREHHGILSSWTIRQNPQISANVLGHIQEHLVHLKSLGTQELLMVLGFPTPPVQPLPPEALGAMQGTPGGPPPANPGGMNPQGRPEAEARAPRQPQPPAISEPV